MEQDLEELMELSSAFYWEQDAHYRFTQSIGQSSHHNHVYPQGLLGCRRWEGGAQAISDNGSWERHKADLEARRPFMSFLYKRPTANGTLRYISSNGHPVFDNDGQFIGYRGIARDVTQEQRALHLLRLEHAVTRSLAEADDIKDALESSIQAICEAEGFESGIYWNLDEASNQMRHFAGWHVDSEAMQDFTQHVNTVAFDFGSGLVGWAWQHNQPLWISDAANEPRVAYKDKLQRVGIQCLFSMPVTWHNKVIGILDFSSTRKLPQPDEVLLSVLRVLGAQIGQFYQRALSQELLRESEARLISTFELAAVGIAHVDAEGRFLYANPKLCEILGYSREELKKLTVKQVSHPDDANITNETRAKLRAGEIPSFTIEKRNIRKDGSTVWVSITIAVKRDDNGQPLHDISVYEDISARKHAEEVLRESEERFRAMSNLSSDWYWEMDADFRLTRLEGRVSYGGKDGAGNSVLGKKRWESGLLIEDEGGWPAHQEILKQQLPFRDVVVYRTQADGNTSYFSISGEPVYDSQGTFTGYRGVGKDITDRKQAEAHIQYLATHDGLTELPNRVMFGGLIKLAIESCKRYDRKFAVLFIDLDRFKIVNDTLGHEAGDILLKEMATRFKHCLRSSDVIARLGGDEFVVLLQEIDSEKRATCVARKILSAAMQPLEILGHECRVTASVGIAIYPQHAADEQSVMKNADIAMYLAKEQGKNTFQFYSKEVQTLSHEKLALENGIRNALERNELSLCYQAKRDLSSGRITGAEALLRWNSPALGSVSPARFIPLAEDTGMIIPIGRWVLKTACAQNVAWQRAGLPPLCMAINLSPRQFHDHDLLQNIQDILAETGMDPQLLELEITESVVMHDAGQVLKTLEAIKKLGIRLAIDDFGTGYSSLAQLKQFPIDTIKVDRSFIHDLPTDSENKAITEAIISMGRKLNLTIVAEGVETAEQEQYLRNSSCNEMQGFYFSKPIPALEFEQLISKSLTEKASS